MNIIICGAGRVGFTIAKQLSEQGHSITVIDPSSEDIQKIDENNSYILNHSWKGNVRELRNLIERIAILQPDTKDKISNIIKESLKNTNFDDQLSENSLSVPLKEAREKFEKEYLTIQLKKFNGNISKTANFVGMERSALHRKLKGLGIKEFN